jgi:hypothetical protein
MYSYGPLALFITVNILPIVVPTWQLVNKYYLFIYYLFNLEVIYIYGAD